MYHYRLSFKHLLVSLPLSNSILLFISLFNYLLSFQQFFHLVTLSLFSNYIFFCFDFVFILFLNRIFLFTYLLIVEIYLLTAEFFNFFANFLVHLFICYNFYISLIILYFLLVFFDCVLFTCCFICLLLFITEGIR